MFCLLKPGLSAIDKTSAVRTKNIRRKEKMKELSNLIEAQTEPCESVPEYILLESFLKGTASCAVKVNYKEA